MVQQGRGSEKSPCPPPPALGPAPLTQPPSQPFPSPPAKENSIFLKNIITNSSLSKHKTETN